MAVVFTVEDGTGVAGANSYLSVAEADDILIVNIQNYATWSALTTQQKEYLLIWATRTIDQYVDWFGAKTDEDNALRWPRTGVTDRDGNAIDDDEIPQALKNAVAELAIRQAIADRTGEQGRDGIKRVKADVVEIEFDSDYRIGTLPDDIAFMLKGLGIVHTGRGVGFGIISRS